MPLHTRQTLFVAVSQSIFSSHKIDLKSIISPQLVGKVYKFRNNHTTAGKNKTKTCGLSG